MDSLLSLPFGLLFWTIVNFGIFLILIIKFGGKGILKAVQDRESSIQQAINAAEEANRNAQLLLKESREKIDTTQQEVVQLLQKGREQAEAIIRKTNEDAEKIKQAKLEDAIREIERSKDVALNQLRTEVADMVINATEKIISIKLDKEKDLKLVESYLDKLPKN